MWCPIRTPPQDAARSRTPHAQIERKNAAFDEARFVSAVQVWLAPDLQRRFRCALGAGPRLRRPAFGLSGSLLGLFFHAHPAVFNEVLMAATHSREDEEEAVTAAEED